MSDGWHPSQSHASEVSHCRRVVKIAASASVTITVTVTAIVGTGVSKDAITGQCR